MLKSLVELARHTSGEGRRDVLHAMSRVFVERSDTHTARELALFCDIFLRLMDQVADEDRAQFARRIARAPQTPHDLALKLAYDESLVAAPVLEFSPVLTIHDLIPIAREMSQDHALAIARRAGIPEPVTDTIVDRGELLVLNTVTRNLSARLSREGFERVVRRAMVDPLLGDALSLRPDLPLSFARRIVTTLQPDARKRVELLLKADGDRVADLMGKAMEFLHSARSEQSQNRSDVRRMILDVRSQHRKLDDAIDELVFEKRPADIAMVLAELAEIRESHVSSVLHKVNPTGIGVVCRALDLSEPTFRRLCVLRCEKLRLPLSQVDQMVRDYANIDSVMAERSLSYHRLGDGQQLLERA